jgi:hypothetical protein
MKINRRGLLGLFGIGAVVAPVVNGLADDGNHVRLIEAPKIQALEPPKLVTVDAYHHLLACNKLDVTIYARDRKLGTVMRMDCSAFLTSVQANIADVTSFDSELPWLRRMAVVSQTLKFEATGEPRLVQAG